MFRNVTAPSSSMRPKRARCQAYLLNEAVGAKCYRVTHPIERVRVAFVPQLGAGLYARPFFTLMAFFFVFLSPDSTTTCLPSNAMTSV